MSDQLLCKRCKKVLPEEKFVITGDDFEEWRWTDAYWDYTGENVCYECIKEMSK